MITQIVDDFAKDPIEEHESNLNKSNHEVRVLGAQYKVRSISRILKCEFIR
jgi:hypothetical protein